MFDEKKQKDPSSRWRLSVDGEENDFASFDEAVKAFRKQIMAHLLRQKDLYLGDAVPFFAGAHFNHLYDQGTIRDEEIVAEVRLKRLLDALRCLTAEEAKKQALRALIGPFSLESAIEEFGENLRIDIRVANHSINAFVEETGPDSKVYLKTNAFVFDNPKASYCFFTKQVIAVSQNVESLGKEIQAAITLIHVED